MDGYTITSSQMPHPAPGVLVQKAVLQKLGARQRQRGVHHVPVVLSHRKLHEDVSGRLGVCPSPLVPLGGGSQEIRPSSCSSPCHRMPFDSSNE